MPSFYQVEGISPRSLSISVECWEQNVWLCAPNRGSALYRFQWYALSQFLLFFWGGLHRTLSSSWSSGLKYVNGLSFSIFAFWRIISPHFCKNQCSFNGADPGKQRWPIRVVTCDGLRAGPIRIFSGTWVELQGKTTIFSSFETIAIIQVRSYNRPSFCHLKTVCWRMKTELRDRGKFSVTSFELLDPSIPEETNSLELCGNISSHFLLWVKPVWDRFWSFTTEESQLILRT